MFDFSYAKTYQAVLDTLKRLQLDYVDSMQVARGRVAPRQWVARERVAPRGRVATLGRVKRGAGGT